MLYKNGALSSGDPFCEGTSFIQKGVPKIENILLAAATVVGLFLLLLLSLLIKSSLGMTALLIRRLLLLGVAALPQGAARLLLHLINDEL